MVETLRVGPQTHLLGGPRALQFAAKRGRLSAGTEWACSPQLPHRSFSTARHPRPSLTESSLRACTRPTWGSH